MLRKFLPGFGNDRKGKARGKAECSQSVGSPTLCTHHPGPMPCMYLTYMIPSAPPQRDFHSPELPDACRDHTNSHYLFPSSSISKNQLEIIRSSHPGSPRLFHQLTLLHNKGNGSSKMNESRRTLPPFHSKDLPI